MNPRKGGRGFSFLPPISVRIERRYIITVWVSACLCVFLDMTAHCLTSSRAVWGISMRWWCMKQPRPSSTCPTAPPESSPLLCLVGFWIFLCVFFCTWKPGSKIESHNYEKPSRYCGGGNGLPCVCLRHFLIDVHIGGLSSSVLQLFCSSPKAALRYAAVRTLNKVSLFSCLILSDVCVVVLIFHIVVSGSILLLISNRAPQVRTAFRTFSFI